MRAYNADQREHDEDTLTYREYLRSAHFGEATFENWESEFLQMGAYVLLTVKLRQKGSAESKPIDEEDPSDEDPAGHRDDPDAPGPHRAGGVALTVYENSLTVAFTALFLLSWWLHAVTGAHHFSEEQVTHGGEAVTTLQYVTHAQFWFESLQNWQSEFMAVLAIVGLSVFLRQRGSPESKPVHAPHAETGA
jgi:hypothetical protein